MLELRGVSKAFGRRVVLKSLDVSFQAGAATAVVGPNGSGKSTLLRTLWGELAPDEGAVAWEGRQVDTSSDSWKRIVGAVPDDDALIEGLSIRGHFELCGALSGLDPGEAARRTESLLELFGLCAAARDTASADEASRGNRKRLACALSLLGEPRLVAMDEPFSGLDAESSSALSAVIRLLASRGLTVVFSSHDEGLTRAAADRFLLLGGAAPGEPGFAESGPVSALPTPRMASLDFDKALPWIGR